MDGSQDSSNDSQLKWWRSPGVIYFLAAGIPATAIRIGVTTRATLLDRMKKTQAHNHEPIELMGVIRFSDGEFPTRDAEDQLRQLHAEFSLLCRFKAHTRGAEWFNPSPECFNTSLPPPYPRRAWVFFDLSARSPATMFLSDSRR